MTSQSTLAQGKLQCTMNLDPKIGELIQNNIQSLPADLYAEARIQTNVSSSIALQKGTVTGNTQDHSSGFSARAYYKGQWGFASTTSIDPSNIQQTLKNAIQNAQFLGSKSPQQGTLSKGKPLILEKSYASSKNPGSQGDWLNWLTQLDHFIKEQYPDLVSRLLFLRSLDIQKWYFNSEGSKLQSFVPRAHLYCQMTKDSEFGPISFMESQGGLGQKIDLFDFDPKNLKTWCDQIYKVTSQKTQGILPEAGVHEVILGPDLAGILAHEAVGHTVESDIVLGGSVAGDLLDKQVASPLINLVDFANTVNGSPAPIPVDFDDEGIACQDTTIIKDGQLKTYMNNRETSAHLNQNNTGHARAFLFSDEPLIRMRNTAILPGNSKLEHMIASVKKGYYLLSPGNGQADTTGEFMFAVGQGYEIIDGKLGRPLRDTTISGVAFEMLKTVTAVSDDFVWVSSGFCGKKQPMPVGMGGPAIQCKIKLGGQ